MIPIGQPMIPPIEKIAELLSAQAGPAAPQSQISVRRIRNGYIMTYFEAEPVDQAIYAPREVEVYIAGPGYGAEVLEEALRNAELLAESAKAVRADAERERRRDRRTTRPPRTLGPKLT